MAIWRCIVHDAADAPTNMAIDEAMLISGTPTLRLYTWQPSALSIGYFQGIHEEVDLETCQRHHVDIVRRISGGGAVYHDAQGEVTYSLVLPETALPRDVQQSCERVCTALAAGLQHLGLDARFSPLNDVVVNGKKISGSAQTRRRGHVLQHGTVLLDVDVGLMFSLLRVSQAKIADKGIKDASARVTSLRHLVDGIDNDAVIAALREGFADTFHVTLQDGRLTDDERERLPVLRDKYASQDWNFQR
jgi:lipoate-protein ligase A